MALTPDYTLRIIHSDASITDAPAFHAALRDFEASETGVLHPTIHTYKEVDLGGGAVFPAIDFINGWALQFPAGNWVIAGGNINAPINPVAGCYVKQTQSAAYAVTAIGSGGGIVPPTAGENAAAVWAQLLADGMAAEDLLTLAARFLLAKATGHPSAPVIRDLTDTKDALTFTLDADGNRVPVLRDPT